MTQEQLDDLKAQLKRLKEVKRPDAIKQTKEYAQNGDFSENAEYQIAKGRLRGINRAITELEYRIPRAIIIETPTETDVVQMGHTVTVQMEGGKEVTWKILGPNEANPEKGIISYVSPIGAALLGKAVGDVAEVELPAGNMIYTIIKIS